MATIIRIRAGPKRGHSILRLVTLEVLTTSAPNLAQINVILFLTLPRNLFETTFENKVAPSIESQYPWRALVDIQPKIILCNRPNRRPWNVHLPSNFVRIFVDAQSTFMTADELPHKFAVFWNSDVRTDRGRLLPFGPSVTPVELIFFSSRSTLVLAQFFPVNFLNKRCELQFFSWRETLIIARSSFLILLISSKTFKICHLLWHGNVYCRSSTIDTRHR